jgi:hypothetical protein
MRINCAQSWFHLPALKQNQAQRAQSVYLNVCPARVNPKIVFALLVLLFLELFFIFQLQDKINRL